MGKLQGLFTTILLPVVFINVPLCWVDAATY